MCGRFVQRYTWDDIQDLYDLPDGPARNLQAHYNVTPTDPVEVVRPAANGVEAGQQSGGGGWKNRGSLWKGGPGWVGCVETQGTAGGPRSSSSLAYYVMLCRSSAG